MTEDSKEKLTEKMLMKEAKRRMETKKSFKTHALVYVLVNAFLILTALMRNGFAGMGPGNFQTLPLIGWGIGIVAHGIYVLTILTGKPYEMKLQAEYELLKKKVEKAE